MDHLWRELKRDMPANHRFAAIPDALRHAQDSAHRLSPSETLRKAALISPTLCLTKVRRNFCHPTYVAFALPAVKKSVPIRTGPQTAQNGRCQATTIRRAAGFQHASAGKLSLRLEITRFESRFSYNDAFARRTLTVSSGSKPAPRSIAALGSGTGATLTVVEIP